MATRTRPEAQNERQEERSGNGKEPFLKIGPFYSGSGYISVAVWQNEGKNGPSYSVSWSKRYRDSEGNYKDSDTLFHAELPVLVFALEEAYRAIHHEQARK